MLKQALYKFEARSAVEHLFRVASGLESLVVGETDVLLWGKSNRPMLLLRIMGSPGK